MATITLFKNVPWSQGGFNVLRFPNVGAQQTYFNSLESLIKDNINYEPRPGANLNLDISLMDAKEYNYLRWEDDVGGPLYYFIEDYEFLNDRPTTRIIISEDIWQNNHLKMNIADGIVHRRHMPRWDGNTPILYPIDEGTARTMKSNVIEEFGTGELVFCLIITSKAMHTETKFDGIWYYYTVVGRNGYAAEPSNGATTYIDPFNSTGFLADVGFFGIAPSDVVGVYALPWFPPSFYTADTSGTFAKVDFSSSRFISYKSPDPNQITIVRSISTIQGDAWGASYPVNIPLPSKGTSSDTSGYSYEPQAWGEGTRRLVITDSSSNPIIDIPRNLAWSNPSISLQCEYQSLSPNLRIGLTGGSLSEGTTAIITLPAIDVAQSQWLNYAIQSRTQDKQILENNISSRYVQSAISAVANATAAGSFGYQYAQSFNNSRRSPTGAGLAGAALGGLSGVGSLINAYVQASADRDNFRLNEQKIKNSSSPPIAGNNYWNFYNGGIKLIELVGDEVSRNTIAFNYIANGVLVDKVGSIPLRTRYYFDYIQTKNCCVQGAMTNNSKTYLEDIFNRGVTVWHGETFRGFKYDLNNIEVA